MRNEARIARAARMKAAKRLIQQQHVPPVMIAPKKQPQHTRRMVQPKELEVTIVAA